MIYDKLKNEFLPKLKEYAEKEQDLKKRRYLKDTIFDLEQELK